MCQPDHELFLRLYDRRRHEIKIFMETVLNYIGEHPELNDVNGPIVHSYKSRLKDREHLRQKITRKMGEGVAVTDQNFFDKITDLAGVRILHLYQEHFRSIDGVIRQRINDGDWYLAERAKVYTWDPENTAFFNEFDVDISTKSSSYTSAHYLLKPRQDSLICCELQVRTLFEEIWGEVDHRINYPTPTESLSCREQIMVLSKIVGAGSRLLDSIDRAHTQRNSDS